MMKHYFGISRFERVIIEEAEDVAKNLIENDADELRIGPKINNLLRIIARLQQTVITILSLGAAAVIYGLTWI